MTSPALCIGPDTSIHAAVRLMDDAEVRHLPVVWHKKLVGIVSDRDLLRGTGWGLVREVARGHAPASSRGRRRFFAVGRQYRASWA